MEKIIKEIKTVKAAHISFFDAQCNLLLSQGWEPLFPMHIGVVIDYSEDEAHFYNYSQQWVKKQ